MWHCSSIESKWESETVDQSGILEYAGKTEKLDKTCLSTDLETLGPLSDEGASETT